jgi:hypothetical protein
MKLSARIGRALRTLADRIDDHGAPRATGWTFTFERNRGMVFHDIQARRGCPVWYIGQDDYAKAHTEAIDPI